jgi:hypothetical protein
MLGIQTPILKTEVDRFGGSMFSGVAAKINIQGFFVIPNLSTAPNVSDSAIRSYLTSSGWSVASQLITTLAGDNIWGFSIDVNGNTSDNLSTVARNFANTLSRYGVTTQGVIAKFYDAQTQAQIPTQAYNAQTAQRTAVLRFSFTANWSATLTAWDLNSLIAQTLSSAGWLIDMPTTIGTQHQLTAHVNAGFTDQDLVNALQRDLSSVGTVSNITVIQNLAGQNIVNPVTNLPQTSSGLESIFSNIGSNLGLAGASALTGGLLVGGVLLFILLKK